MTTSKSPFIRALIHTFLSGAVGLSAAGLQPAFADITRGCNAELVVSVNGSGHDLTYTYRAEVNAQNRAWANRAREKARENILSCFRAHWDMRMSDASPSWCRPEGGMYGYPFRALSQDLTRDICAANPGRDSFTIDISVAITGERGCELGNEWVPVSLIQDYRIYCALPAQPTVRDGFNLPRQDYRWFPAPGLAWQDCQQTCADEDRCQAWTFKYATGDDPALCFLKQGVPEWHRDARFISGIKGDVLH